MTPIDSITKLAQLLDGLDEATIDTSDDGLFRETAHASERAESLRAWIEGIVPSRVPADPSLRRQLLTTLLARRGTSSAPGLRFESGGELSDNAVEELLHNLLEDAKRGHDE